MTDNDNELESPDGEEAADAESDADASGGARQ